MSKSESPIIELPQTDSRIGTKTKYTGTLSFITSLSVLGSVYGKIQGGELLVVYPMAHIEADIHAEYVLVAGKVSGSIYAKKGVCLYSGAELVKCSISSAVVRMQTGVNFEGTCNMLDKKNIDIFSISQNEFKAQFIDKISQKNESF